MTRVRAPGSSANLGPGFDVLGLAVARYVWAWDEEDPGRPGADRGNPCGPDHIAKIAYEQAGGSGPLWFDFELEPSRGLGFSAAARAAGAMLAKLQQGHDLATAQKLAYEVVAEIEGHGDNAAPAVFGGTHVIADQFCHRLGTSFPGQLLFWVPEFETLTDDSRACLAPTVDRADAVFNLGCIALLISSIYEDRLDLLHQPLRTDSINRNGSPPVTCRPRLIPERLKPVPQLRGLAALGQPFAVVVSEDLIESVSAVLAETGKVLALDVDETGAIPID